MHIISYAEWIKFSRGVNPICHVIFALFPKLKDELKGKHFNDLDELRWE